MKLRNKLPPLRSNELFDGVVTQQLLWRPSNETGQSADRNAKKYWIPQIKKQFGQRERFFLPE
jgi:hypothetical protein